MKLLADGVWRLKQFPAPSVNVYLAGDVLIDAGTRWDRHRVFAEIEGRELSLLALTHVHPDHQGVAKDVCEARGEVIFFRDSDRVAICGDVIRNMATPPGGRCSPSRRRSSPTTRPRTAARSASSPTSSRP